MNLHSDAEDRLWESQCRLPTTVRSLSAVRKLRAMPADDQTRCIAKYAQHNLPHLLRCALTAGVSSDTRFGEDNTPVLCLAAERGNDRALEALLVGRANLALADSEGWTAAHLAAYKGHAPCLRLLLDAGVPKEVKTEEGATPLHLAAQEGHAECCSLLLAAGCSVDARTNVKRTPLHCAAENGHLSVIRQLLDAGASPDAVARNVGTALDTAAAHGKVEAVKLLLACGAKPNTVDFLGNTPLMTAIANKRLPCVEVLLPVSDLSITSRQGRNALHISIVVGNAECFELLLPLMGDVDVHTVQVIQPDGSPYHVFNSTPLQLACSFGQHEMAKALLRRGALRTTRDSLQRTPLHDAACAGHLSCVAMLLGKHGSYKLTPNEVNAADKRGCMPLHYAAFEGHAQICGKLLAAGARLDAVTSEGATPLMFAQHKHPANTALLDLLAGRGPAHPPGTVCDGCGRPEAEVRLRTCDGCLVARYCGNACAKAAWLAHKAECKRLQAVRESRSTVKIAQPGGSSAA